MRTRWRFGALIVTTGLLLAPATAGQALPNHGGRANDWVEVWCDTNTANADGDAITSVDRQDGTTRGGADDVAGEGRRRLGLRSGDEGLEPLQPGRRGGPGVVLRCPSLRERDDRQRNVSELDQAGQDSDSWGADRLGIRVITDVARGDR